MQPTAGVYTTSVPHNLDFVAMLFSGSGGHLISDMTGASPPVTALLGFNEPNNPIQVRRGSLVCISNPNVVHYRAPCPIEGAMSVASIR